MGRISFHLNERPKTFQSNANDTDTTAAATSGDAVCHNSLHQSEGLTISQTTDDSSADGTDTAADSTDSTDNTADTTDSADGSTASDTATAPPSSGGGVVSEVKSAVGSVESKAASKLKGLFSGL